MVSVELIIIKVCIHCKFSNILPTTYIHMSMILNNIWIRLLRRRLIEYAKAPYTQVYTIIIIIYRNNNNNSNTIIIIVVIAIFKDFKNSGHKN